MLGVVASGRRTAATDANFNVVSLLLPMHDAAGATTGTDVSPRVKTMTRGNTGGISATGAHFGNNSWAQGNVGDYLGTPDHVDFDPGTGPLMVEFFVYTTAAGTVQVFFQKAVGTGLYPYNVQMNAANKFRFLAFNNSSSLIVNLTGTTTIANSTLYFVQAGRCPAFGTATTYGLAVNGSIEATVDPGAQTMFQNSGKLIIGGDDGSGSFPLKGGMNNIRMSLCDRPIAVPTAQWPEAGP
jgi:hypothetical protein